MTKNFNEFHKIRSAHKGGPKFTPEELAMEQELSSVKSTNEGKELKAKKAAEKKQQDKAAKKTQQVNKQAKKPSGAKTAPKDNFNKVTDEDLINLADVAEAQAKASKK